jgi:predicted nucleic-acid-binding Zn-ribbon protein
MKQVSKSKCPKCGSEQFISQPNRYDRLRFVNRQFQVEKSEFINEEERIFCRECSVEVDKEGSIQNKKIILKDIR